MKVVNQLEQENKIDEVVANYRNSSISQEMEEKQNKIEESSSNESLIFGSWKDQFPVELKKFWILYKRSSAAIFFASQDRLRAFLCFLTVIVEILAAFQLPKLVDNVRDRIGELASLLVAFLLFSATISVSALENFKVFKREFNKGLYSVETFFLSSQLAHTTQDAVLNIFCHTILYWGVGFYASASNYFLYLFINLISYLTWIQFSLLLVPIIQTFSLSISLLGKKQKFNFF